MPWKPQAAFGLRPFRSRRFAARALSGPKFFPDPLSGTRTARHSTRYSTRYANPHTLELTTIRRTCFFQTGSLNRQADNLTRQSGLFSLTRQPGQAEQAGLCPDSTGFPPCTSLFRLSWKLFAAHVLQAPCAILAKLRAFPLCVMVNHFVFCFPCEAFPGQACLHDKALSCLLL